MFSNSNSDRFRNQSTKPRGQVRIRRLILVALALFFLPSLLRAEEEAVNRGIEVRFHGNHNISESDLRRAAREELKAFERNDGRKADLDDAVFQMRLAYRAAGYAFATLDYDQTVRDDALQVDIRVTEGPRVAVDKIAFTGRVDASAGDLEALMGLPEGLLGPKAAPPFVQSQIEAGIARVRDFYLARGYLDVAVGEPRFLYSEDRTRVSVEIPLSEGRRYRLTDIRFRGDLPEAAAEGLAAVRHEMVGAAYNHSHRLVLRSRLEEIYGNLGYAEMRVDIEEERLPAPKGILLTATIRSGASLTIGEVRVQGNEKTSAAFIRRRIQLMPGDRYSLTGRRESFRSLYRSGLFARVDLSLEDRGRPGQRDLVVSVEERPSRAFFIEPGWGSYELLRLKMGFRQKNLFGSGRSLGIETTASVKARQVVINLVDPWFLDTEITADLPLSYSYREEPSFTREDIGLAASFSRRLSEHVSATAAYTLRNTDLSDIDADVGEDVRSDTYNFASLSGQGTFDDRDDPFYPTRGKQLAFGLEHADSALGGDVTFTRITTSLRYFHALNPETVLALRYATGFIFPGGGEGSVPISERFFNGGESSVRSFRQSELGPKDLSGDPVGGLAFNTVNVELRRRLMGDLSGSLFFDLGNVAPNRSYSERGRPVPDNSGDAISDTLDDFLSDFRSAIGVGLHYQLPVGPIRCDLAFNPDADDDRDEDQWVFHFSVGMAF